MYRYFDKLIVFLLCSILYIPSNTTMFNVVYLLIALITICLTGYFDNKYIRMGIQTSYFLFACFNLNACFFIPVIVYDSVIQEEKWGLLAYGIPLLIHLEGLSLNTVFIILALIACSYHLCTKSATLITMEKQTKKVKDDSEELRLLQEQKQRELLEKQDYEIQLAKAEERNRIAREIHDSVGHNLSSSLLQIGAMIAINNNEDLQQPLQDMRKTLADGMDSIRKSVHNLHEDTFSLKEEMEQLIQHFTFCDTSLQYTCSGLLDIKLKYCFINILKEALNNVSKHSNATQVTISFVENPSFYQFLIHDNGTTFINKDGLGLKSIYERVYAYDGICSITHESGFRIFINIPKEVQS